MPTHPLLALARTMGNPVVEGDVVTFIWQGLTAPDLIDDRHNWEEAPQKLLHVGTELWSYSLPLPPDAYLEYAFVDPVSGTRLPDPLNANKVENGMGAYNHYVYMPQAKPSPYIKSYKGMVEGKLVKFDLPTREYAVGAKRTVHLYSPATEEAIPLLVVYDGNDYLKRAKLNIIVDNLIADKRIRPIALALIQNGGSSARTVEYSCSEATLGFVTECVLPLAQEQLKLEPARNGHHGVMGASLGGSMALYTALRLPQIFHRVLSQSGAFFAPDYPYIGADLVRFGPRPDLDIWMDAGRLEWLLPGNQQMFALLKEKKYKVRYHEFSGGHNYTAWRDDVSHGLEALYSR
jgi:enterochelin esterase-like enzyme